MKYILFLLVLYNKFSGCININFINDCICVPARWFSEQTSMGLLEMISCLCLPEV